MSMNMHKHYQMVGGAIPRVVEQVNNMIQDGWIPCGGVMMTPNGDVFQAMWYPPVPTEIITRMENVTTMKAIKND
jgi:hypothetical protein